METEGLGSRVFLVGRVRDRVSAGLSLTVSVLPYVGVCLPAGLGSRARVRGVVLEKLESLFPAGLGSRDLSLLEVKSGIFLDSTGLGSRDRIPVFMAMLLLNFFGSAGLGSRDRVIVFVVVIFGVAGLGSRDRAVNDFMVRLGSAGLGSRDVRVRTVGLGSLDRARF